MTEAHTTSGLHSLIPTSASWGVIAAELAVLFFLLAIVFAWFARRGRKQRIQAATALLEDRDDMADTATQTMAMHLKALLSGQDPSEADMDDYRKRSRKLIGALCQPWLEPSKGALRDAAHEILALRHTDLHQFAGILGSPLVKESDEQKAVLEHTRQELDEAKKAEALRSRQLQEALTTIGTMVAEYGRKFGASTDSRTGQVLRALIYLQALDEGNDPARAKEIVDETLSEDLEVLKEQPEQAPEAPNADAIAAAAAAEAADLSTELEDAAEAMAAAAAELSPGETSAEPEAQYDDNFDDLEAIEPEIAQAPDESLVNVEAETGIDESIEDESMADQSMPGEEIEEAVAIPEAPSSAGLDALDDIDALIAQAQTQIDKKSSEPAAAEAEPSEATAAQVEAAAPKAADLSPAPAEIQSGSAPKPEVESEVESGAESAASTQAGSKTAEQQPAVPATKASTPEPAKPESEAAIEPAGKSEDQVPDVEAEPASEASDNEHEDLDEIVDLDEVELPKKTPAAAKPEDGTGAASENATGAADTFDLDLDDIDALLDAEIARHQGPDAGDKSNDEDLDLSKP